MTDSANSNNYDSDLTSQYPARNSHANRTRSRSSQINLGHSNRERCRTARKNLFSDDHGNALPRFILAISGLIGIAAFFLPFCHLNLYMYEINMSGLDMGKMAYTYVRAIDCEEFENVKNTIDSFKTMISTSWGQVTGSLSTIFNNVSELSDVGGMIREVPILIKGVVILLTTFLIVLGPIVFPILALRALIRAFGGETSSGGLELAFLYTILVVVASFWTGSEIGVEIKFFKFVDVAYWMSMVSMLLMVVPPLLADE